MEKLQYLNTEYEIPIKQGDDSGTIIVEPSVEFVYFPQQDTIPTKLSILMIHRYVGQYGFDFSVTVKMLSNFIINDWLSMNDVHKAHLIMIDDLKKYLKSDKVDYRFREYDVPIPTLDRSIYLMGGSDSILFFINDFTG